VWDTIVGPLGGIKGELRVNVHYLHYPHLTMDRAFGPSVIAIGNFDGVHCGHRRVIETAQRLAREQGVEALVFTFVEHPRTVLRPDSPVPLLTPWPEKLERLAALGVEGCVAAHFTPDLAQLGPEEFVLRILLGQLNAKAVVTGFNFRFGHRQAGSPEVLKALGEREGFQVEIVQPYEEDGGVVSSSRLREMVATGAIEPANQMLGYRYTLTGTVIHGDKRGRTIGFPTANLEVSREKLLPAYGVYACWVDVGGQKLPGIVNIGQRPTFDPPKLMIEAHIFDWSGDIYGETISVSLVSRLRAEQAFPSVDALVAQIKADCRVARETLGVAVPG
jgi:riboflavin kinase/FMN adenylyltransferase